MATSGVLKITTRLAKEEFKKDLKSLKTDIKSTEAETNALGEGTEAMAGGLSSSVGSIAKMAIIAALVVGAFTVISKAVKNITENNEALASKIEAIKTALSNIGTALINVVSNIILPVVEAIVNLIYKILSYVNAITKAWWNYDLFAESASDSLSSGASSAQAIEKALAGFDTADVLGKEDNSVVSSSSVKTAKKLNGELSDIPTWLQKIIDLKPTLDVLFEGAISGASSVWTYLKEYSPLVGLTTGGIKGMVKNVDNLSQKWKEVKENLKEEHPYLYLMLQLLGGPIFLAVDGILTYWDEIKEAIKKCVEIIKSFFNWLEKIEDKFDSILEDMGLMTDEYKEQSKSASYWSALGAVTSGKSTSSTAKEIDWSSIWDSAKAATSGLLGVAKSKLGLASGGIVNNPGPGVPLSQITVGEKGAEAVLPLTDGTLQKLASMIPVQIELTNTIDGRVLSRRLETIRQNTAFSRNGA